MEAYRCDECGEPCILITPFFDHPPKDCSYKYNMGYAAWKTYEVK